MEITSKKASKHFLLQIEFAFAIGHKIQLDAVMKF